MLLICYEKCSTCKGIEKKMDALGLTYDYRPINKENPDIKELAAWHKASNLPLKQLFNTSGALYREAGLATKLPQLGEEEQLQILASNGMMVKRPILILEDGQVFVGRDVAKYLDSL